MFFVTRFLERFWAWTRTQSGSSDLKALLYFDEIFGYLPPVAEPPSKRPLLSLLKQARAFGVGVLVVTQNPVDLDYKALSNTGTWMVGRLQAERDKERLLDGLEGAGLGMARAEADRTLSGLEKRRFLLHDVHRSGGPVVFETRWARAYLRGPLSASAGSRTSRAKFAEPAPAGKSVETPGGTAAAHRAVSARRGRRSGASRARPGLPGALRSGTLPGARRSPGKSPRWSRCASHGSAPRSPGRSGVSCASARAPAPVPAADGGIAARGLAGHAPCRGDLRPAAVVGDAAQRRGRARAGGQGLRRGGRVHARDRSRARPGPPAGGERRGFRRARRRRPPMPRPAGGREKIRGPRERRIATLERQIAEETRELERDRAEQTRAATYSAIDVGASVLGTLFGGGRRSVGTAGRAGGRAYGRIQRAAEDVKESEEKIAAWTRERDALEGRDRGRNRGGAGAAGRGGDTARERRGLPIEKSDVRVLSAGSFSGEENG